MGERPKQALRVQFDGKLKHEFHGANVTSDAGLLAFHALNEAFRLTEKGCILLSDSRRGKNTQHTLLAMLRQRVYGRLAGYEDANDANRLSVDPVMRHVVGGQGVDHTDASPSQVDRHEPAGRLDVQRPLRLRVLSPAVRV